ncbi:cytochrome b/b6 domain-containing protein [Uliginosibacterium aquaticum]|uniref:Cytochrome b/b6 domain-containing protein n=1 Tax=Uliginosibacterium aquaticum TaxID=2731212 RepID=A0ABX2IDX2_9RHOO|nr:cytochrome b/b6 domain-containing protein [Uliginosibacterium aquaticum]NSL54527.1 cytochrome b/b6 domain-containing protein [Uliginosibacterium aquaticum]
MTVSTRRIKVWDLPLRLFHWSLLLCVAGAVISIEVADNIDWHQRFGIAVLTLLVFRLLWGIVGGQHARFANFLRSPASILGYVKRMKDEKGPAVGHNPLGALSVLGLLAVLLFQAGSGLFLSDEIMFEGPLFKFVSGEIAGFLAEAHEANAGIIFTLIGLHLAAILFYRFVKRDNLITPMLTGSKEVPAETPVQDANGGSALLGLITLAVAAGVVWFIVTL